MDQLVTVTLYSRPGCHLCEEMKAAVDAAARRQPLHVEVIDITSDPALEARYGAEIPVLLVSGRRVAKYRISSEALARALSGAGSPGGPAPE